jgi:hypothetical protein
MRRQAVLSSDAAKRTPTTVSSGSTCPIAGRPLNQLAKFERNGLCRAGTSIMKQTQASQSCRKVEIAAPPLMLDTLHALIGAFLRLNAGVSG